MQRFGPYEVIRPLGRGGMGEVFAVRGPDGATYALKTLSRGPLSTPPSDVDRQRFFAEARLLAELDHPHIVKVHDAELVDRTPYLVQDLLPGGSLQERLRAGPLPVAEAVELVTALATALEHAHARGVLHRDLKPDNVLFDADGRPQLVDFGLARTLQDVDRLTRTGEIVGTPTYMAPEQALGTEQGVGVDVYGLGALLYAALTGEPPFPRQNVLQVLVDVTERPPRPLRSLRPEVPPGLEAVCLRALAKAPADRYPSAAALATALRDASPVPPPRRHPLALALGLATLGVVAVALATVDRPRPAPARAANPTAPTAPASPTLGPTPSPTPRPDPHAAWLAALPPKHRPPDPLPPGLRPGAAPGEYVNARDGSVLVWVRPGTVELGPDPERATQVPLSGFFLGKHEVSRAQFAAFWKARTGRAWRTQGWERGLPADRHPALRVDWADARAYCTWAGLSLPSQAQWTWAVRGPRGRRLPWGDARPKHPANLRGAEDGHPRTSPRGAFPFDTTWCGAQDMAGNAQEWTADAFAPFPPGARPRDWVAQHPEGSAERRRVVKGSCWQLDLDEADATERHAIETRLFLSDAIFNRIGFRVARGR